MTSEPADTAGTSGGTQRAVLITGASGEVGHGLIHALHARGTAIIGLDLRPMDAALAAYCAETIAGNVTDPQVLADVATRYEITDIFHLAALLSSRAEQDPELAHEVNVNGSMNLMRFAIEQAGRTGRAVRFVFPSTIAVYGVADLATKEAAGAIAEDSHLQPITMYGVNKLYTEHLGRYFNRHYKQTADPRPPAPIDFRCVRYPGLISAETMPTGGTSDYGPEMLHHAAQGKPYACFVREDARLPFMTMPDAIEATLQLADAPRESLTQPVYNLSAFAPTAGELAALTSEFFPDATISYQPNAKRQGIVDSWPGDVDTSAAARDWGFAPKHDLRSAFADYLVPAIRRRYAAS